MAEDGFACGRSAEVNVGGFPPHGMQETKFGDGRSQGREFDAGAIRGEATNDPAAAQLDKGIRATHGTVDDGLIKDIDRSSLLLRPEYRGWREGLGLTSDASAMPVGDGKVPSMSKAAESGYTMGKAIAKTVCRHEVFEGIECADGQLSFECGNGIHLLPERDGIAQLAQGDKT